MKRCLRRRQRNDHMADFFDVRFASVECASCNGPYGAKPTLFLSWRCTANRPVCAAYCIEYRILSTSCAPLLCYCGKHYECSRHHTPPTAFGGCLCRAPHRRSGTDRSHSSDNDGRPYGFRQCGCGNVVKDAWSNDDCKRLSAGLCSSGCRVIGNHRGHDPSRHRSDRLCFYGQCFSW